MPLFRARPPVEDRERQWIEKMLSWCVEQFGREASDAEVLTPTPSFFPGTYQGTPQDVLDLVDLVRAHLRIDPTEIEFVLYEGRPPVRPSPPAPSTPSDPPGLPGSSALPGPSARLTPRPAPPARPAPAGTSSGGGSKTVAGHYSIRNGIGVLAVGLDNAPDPRRVVAVAAHELCHHKLLYRGPATADEGDHEPLTDLATVFFGLGVFTANAAYSFSQGAGGWRRQQLGYINQPMFGYALARVARLRGERDPAWARHLDTNPRGYFKQAMRYLDRVSPDQPDQ